MYDARFRLICEIQRNDILLNVKTARVLQLDLQFFS